MSSTLIEKIRTSLGFPPLQKIDPNTHHVKDTRQESDPLGQAVIPVVLVGLYKATRSHQLADDLQWGNISTGFIRDTYGDTYPELIEKIAAYADVSTMQAEQTLNETFSKAVAIVKSEVGDQPDGNAFRDYMTGHRSEILTYLPASLMVGENLKDSTLDDRTNKMEGPVSSLMHLIEKAFSSSDSDSDNKISTSQ